MKKNVFGMENVLTFEVSLNEDSKTAYLSDKNWMRNKHYLTICWGEQREEHRIFFDHFEMDPKCVRYGFQDNSIAFEQYIGNTRLGGHIVLSDKMYAKGAIIKGTKTYAADFKQIGAHYYCSVGITDLVGRKIGDQLYYDLSSKQNWDNIDWLLDAFEFRYSLEPAGKIGDEYLYKTVFDFFDNATKLEWQICSNPGQMGDCSFTIGSDSTSNTFYMSLNRGVKVKADDRSHTSEKEKAFISLFPEKFSFQFDSSFFSGNGAMMVSDSSGKKYVYAVSLKPQNPAIVGIYRLDNGKELIINRGRMIIDGKPFNGSHVIGNCLIWKGLQNDSALGETGSLNFSKDGQQILPSNGLGFGGRRLTPQECSKKQLLLESDNSIQADLNNLSILGLINMDPVQEVNKEITLEDGTKKTETVTMDVVQDASMQDFYQMLRYCMPKDLLNNYVGGNTDLNEELRGWLGEKEIAWFQTLAVPYVTNSLALSSSDANTKLNKKRAQSIMKSTMANSKIYSDISKKLYKRQWKNYFPTINDYLTDQVTNQQSYCKEIDEMKNELIQELQLDKTGMPSKDADKYDQAIADIQRLAEIAKAGKYWAFTLYDYLIKYYLPGIFALMISGNTSQNIAMEIKNYSALLEILDDSNTFNSEFVKMTQLFQLAAIMPSLIDYSDHKQSYFDVATELIKTMLANYSDIPDEDVKNHLKDLYDAYQKDELDEMLRPYFEAFSVIAENMAPGMDFSALADLFEQRCISKIAGYSSIVCRLVGFGIASGALVLGIMGDISWQDFTPLQRASVITVGTGLLTEAILKGIRNGLEANAYYMFSGSRLKALGYFLKPMGSVYEDAAVKYESSLAKWMLGRGTYVEPTALQILFDGALSSNDMPVLSKIFGRNLDEFLATRFAAAFAVVGIVLSACELSKSAEPLERDINIIFLSSSCMDLAGALATWTGGMASGEILTSACAWIAGLSTGFGIALALVGLAMLLYLLFNQKPQKTPLEIFCDTYAKPNKLYMEYGFSIEDFAIADSENRTTGIGISNNEHYLYMTDEHNVILQNNDYSYRTVFYSSVDENGQIMFFTIDAAQENATVLALTAEKVGENYQIKMCPKNEQNAKSQKWIPEFAIQNVKTDVCWNNNIVMSAPFTIKNVEYDNLYLIIGEKDELCLDAQHTPWKIGKYGTKPIGISYNGNNSIVFYKDVIGQNYTPSFIHAGSSPLTWSITPCLSDQLVFSVQNGTISQKDNVKLQDETECVSVEAKNQYGAATAAVQIQVKDLETAL